MNSKTIGAALLGSCLMGGLSAAEVRDFAKYVTLTVGESAVAREHWSSRAIRSV